MQVIGIFREMNYRTGFSGSPSLIGYQHKGEWCSSLHLIAVILWFCSSHPCWNLICTITISYKISANAILFKLPDEVCVQMKPVGDNKDNKHCSRS